MSVQECFGVIEPLLPHIVHLLRDDKERVAAVHGSMK
jgi:hypothetical protein